MLSATEDGEVVTGLLSHFRLDWIREGCSGCSDQEEVDRLVKRAFPGLLVGRLHSRVLNSEHEMARVSQCMQHHPQLDIF